LLPVKPRKKLVRAAPAQEAGLNFLASITFMRFDGFNQDAW
jgi:hypothetical protein